MRANISAWIVGFIFAWGLGISGMTDPSKVVGFLNFMGNWDPSLMFVMLGAVVVHSISYRWIKKRNSPVFSQKWFLPQASEITPRLVVGSVIFGIGWGLGGYCPGPALTSIASFHFRPALFVFGMVGGMYVFKLWDSQFRIQGTAKQEG